jgi:hypothetical protein
MPLEANLIEKKNQTATLSLPFRKADKDYGAAGRETIKANLVIMVKPPGFLMS